MKSEKKVERRVGASPILCRVCGRRMGLVRGFEGRIFTLCVECEEVLRAQAATRRQVGADYICGRDPG